jgi:hypothetical protein
MFKKLTDLLQSTQCIQNKEGVISLWKQFGALYETMNDLHPCEEKILSFHKDAKAFISNFKKKLAIFLYFLFYSCTPQYQHPFSVPHFDCHRCSIVFVPSVVHVKRCL